MSSHFKPNLVVLKADAAISEGQAVKIGSDSEHVTPCTAATDKVIGLAQTTVTAAEDLVEVALPGGGAKGLAQATISAGSLLVPHTDGKLKPIAAAGNRLCAVAMDSAVAGDVFDVHVISGQAQATE